MFVFIIILYLALLKCPNELFFAFVRNDGHYCVQSFVLLICAIYEDLKVVLISTATADFAVCFYYS